MEPRDTLTLSKNHVLNSMIGKTVEVHYETRDITMSVKGRLGYDDEFQCYVINLRANGKNVARFGSENMVKVSLVDNILHLESYVLFDN